MKQAILLLFGILILAGSCGDKVDKEIAQVMKQRENAYNSKNLELYTSILSENYLNKTDDRNETKKVAVKNFKINTTPFDIIDMRHRDRTIYKEGDSAKSFVPDGLGVVDSTLGLGDSTAFGAETTYWTS